MALLSVIEGGAGVVTALVLAATFIASIAFATHANRERKERKGER